MTRDPTTIRSWLYAPGHRDRLVVSALRSAADAVVLDLEDGVPPEARGAARETVARVLSKPTPCPVWVRINGPATGLSEADVEAAAAPNLAGVRIAKVETPDEVRAIAGLLAGAAGREVPIHCLLESAQGVEQATEIARAHPAVAGLCLGEADLSADLGTRGEEGLLYARSRCVMAARAAGLAPPVQSVYTSLEDEAGLRASTERGRDLGFFGRSAVHPRQLTAINDVFTPSAEELAAARRLVDALAASIDAGQSAFAAMDGRFVDPAVAQTARRTIQLADRLAGARCAEPPARRPYSAEHPPTSAELPSP